MSEPDPVQAWLERMAQLRVRVADGQVLLAIYALAAAGCTLFDMLNAPLEEGTEDVDEQTVDDFKRARAALGKLIG